MQVILRGLALRVLAAIFAFPMADTLQAADSRAGPIDISVDPKEAYIETRGAEQRLNFAR